MEDELCKSAHKVFKIKYHFVFCIKYRKDLFSNENYVECFRRTCDGIAKRYNVSFETIGFDGDHVHLMVGSIPSYSPSKIFRVVKSITAIRLFEEYPDLKKELWNGEFWSDGGFVGTVGEGVNGEIIRKYIENQGRKVGQLRLVDFGQADAPQLAAGLFTTGYCAADDRRFQGVIEYVRTQLGIPEGSIYDFKIPSNAISIRHYLLYELGGKFKEDPNKLIIVRATGFESLKRVHESLAHRCAAHDYDQGLVERGPEYLTEEALSKKIIVFTQIGYTEGKDAYNLAVRSACGSRFNSFLYEIK